MPATLDLSQFDLPAGALIGIGSLHNDADERPQLLARLQGLIEKGRTDQKEWSNRFAQLYDEARRSDWSVPFLIQWAAALLEKQRAALELFNPLIETLQRRAADYAVRPDAELLELCQETIVLITAWISPYQTLCGKVLELASQRRAAGGEVLRARPVAGEIDYAELSREHIARYPKIRAALAK